MTDSLSEPDSEEEWHKEIRDIFGSFESEREEDVDSEEDKDKVSQDASASMLVNQCENHCVEFDISIQVSLSVFVLEE